MIFHCNIDPCDRHQGLGLLRQHHRGPQLLLVKQQRAAGWRHLRRRGLPPGGLGHCLRGEPRPGERFRAHVGLSAGTEDDMLSGSLGSMGRPDSYVPVCRHPIRVAIIGSCRQLICDALWCHLSAFSGTLLRVHERRTMAARSSSAMTCRRTLSAAHSSTMGSRSAGSRTTHW